MQGAPQGKYKRKELYAMEDYDIGEIESINDMRRPYSGFYFYDCISENSKPLLWVIQRIVDLDKPLTISEISRVSGKSPFFVKKAIDEFEGAGLRMRRYDEKTGEYTLIRY